MRRISVYGASREVLLRNPKATTKEVFAAIKDQFKDDSPVWLMNVLNRYVRDFNTKLQAKQ